MRGFGETLASMRAARSMTQRELADRVGMSDITISRTERDASKPSNAKLLQIIAAMSVVMPLTESEMADLVALGMHAYLLTPYATMPPAAIEGSRRQCEALLNELLSGMDPKPVAQVLHALLSLKSARPVARPIPVSGPTPGPAPGPTLRPIDTSRIPPPPPPPPPEAIRDQPSGIRAPSAADLRAAHVSPMRIAISEGPMPGVPGATEVRYQPISTVAAQLSESLDLPAAQIAAAIRKALKA